VYEFDAVVIGAGIVGLAIASQLSHKFNNVLIVEKESSFGQHTSSRNSGVIHSGIYYPKGTLKSSLCINGNRLLYHFLQRYNLPHKQCGKLIVATTEKEVSQLDIIYRRGMANAVPNLTILDPQKIKEIQPEIKAIKAIQVPSAGIVDAHSLMLQLRNNFTKNNGVVVYNTAVSDVSLLNDKYVLSFEGEDYNVGSRIVINSSGLWSDQIAQMLGIEEYEIEWYKGEYYKTNKYPHMNCLIYPLPSEHGLGIHTVLDMGGNLSFGPNAYYVSDVDYSINDLNHQHFCDSINKYLDISCKDIWADTAGVRPKIKKQAGFKDFIIKNEVDKGYKNFINLVGIESPGLTSCLAIAEYVEKIIEG
jgi:L-2-hydroxyglutarate oxidase LhgO